MAGSVSPAGNIAEGVVEIYAEAERLILARMAAYLKKDSEAPDWMERKLLEVQFLKRQTAHLVNDLGNRAASEVAVALAHAYNRGGAAAAADLAGLLKISLLEASAPTYGLPPVELLVSELMGNLNAAGKQILRSTDDAFRRIVAESAAQVLTGTQTRLQATQTALDRFAQQGITGFINRAGQNMNIASYAEMATRTSASKAFRQASTDRIQQYGLDLVIVPDTPGSCPLCSPWEGQVLSISGDTPGYSTVADAEAGGLGHPNCFPAGVRVSGPAVCAADSRWYEGELVIIGVAGGNELPVTPNHPILTPGGWVAAGELSEGDDVVRYLGQERMRPAVGPDDVEMPALIEEIPGALIESCTVSAVSVPASAEQFHGDGEGGEVKVVFADCLLRRGHEAALCKPILQGSLGAVELCTLFLPQCALAEVGVGALHATDGIMGGGGQGLAALWCHAGHASDGRILAADRRPSFGEYATDVPLVGTEAFADLLLRHAGLVETDTLVYVHRRWFAGHVYNLQTLGGWYSSNGIIAHNCTHAYSAYQEGFTPELKPALDDAKNAELYANNQKLRYLERKTREAKRLEAAAMDPVAARQAKAKVATYQAKIREHVNRTGVRRQNYREQI